MKKIILILIALVVFTPLAVFAQTTVVRGYFRKDGTYVSPHFRNTNPYRSNTYKPYKPYKPKSYDYGNYGNSTKKRKRGNYSYQ